MNEGKSDQKKTKRPQPDMYDWDNAPGNVSVLKKSFEKRPESNERVRKGTQKKQQ